MLQRLKQKIKDGASRAGPPSSSSQQANEGEGRPAMLHVQPTAPTTRHRVIRDAVPPDEELLEELDPGYRETSFEATSATLAALPTDGSLDPSVVDTIRTRKYHELRAVSKKLSSLVIHHQDAFMTEIQRVGKLDEQLSMLLVVCKNERRQLSRVARDTSKNLEAIHKHRKKQKMIRLLHLLQSIRVVRTASVRLAELLAEKEYATAIELYQQCTMLMELDFDFECISELLASLSDAELTILHHIEEDLRAIILADSFDEREYSKISAACALLGQPTLVLDHLCTYMPSYSLAKAKKIVTKYINGFGSRLSFRQLCEAVEDEKAEKCLISMCVAMCEVMEHFERFYAYHMDEIARQEAEADDNDDARSIKGPEGSNEGSNEVSNEGDDVSGAKKNESAEHQVQDTHGQESNPAVHRRKSVSAHVGSLSVDEYTRIKLNHARAKLWQDIQRSMAIFLSTVSFSWLSFSKYLKVLLKVSVLIEIGEDFAQQPAETLRRALEAQAYSYVKKFHFRMTKDLVLAFSREMWTPTDVEKDFNIFLEEEYLFLRKRNQAEFAADGSISIGNHDAKGETLDSFRHNRNVFSDETTSPAATSKSSKQGKKVVGEQSHEQAKEAQNAPTSATAAPTSKKRPPPPHCCATTLRLVKYMGYYLEMMYVLKPLSWTVFKCLAELVFLSVYIVYEFFGKDNTQYTPAILPKATQQLIALSEETMAHLQKGEFCAVLLDDGTPSTRAVSGSSVGTDPPAEAETPNSDGSSRNDAQSSDTTTSQNAQSDAEVNDGGADEQLGVPTPSLFEEIPLESRSHMYALDARITAVEGLTFLSVVLKSIQRHFLAQLPSEHKEAIHAFYAQTVDRFADIRLFIYKTAVDRMMDAAEVLKLMSTAKYDRKEITTDHSSYIDGIVSHFTEINGRLQIFGEARFPAKARELVWAELLHQITRLFVEGFSMPKKCTNEGRALMQLDLRIFLSKVEQFTPIKPNVDVVQSYITAFYLSEGEFTEWVHLHHMNYTLKQLQQLVTVKFSKKALRNKFKLLVEEKFVAPNATTSQVTVPTASGPSANFPSNTTAAKAPTTTSSSSFASTLTKSPFALANKIKRRHQKKAPNASESSNSSNSDTGKKRGSGAKSSPADSASADTHDSKQGEKEADAMVDAAESET